MDNREPTKTPTKEETFNNDLINWIYDSHYWEDTFPGYQKCIWCGRNHTSEMPVTKNFGVCKENPKVKEILIPSK